MAKKYFDMGRADREPIRIVLPSGVRAEFVAPTLEQMERFSRSLSDKMRAASNAMQNFGVSLVAASTAIGRFALAQRRLEEERRRLDMILFEQLRPVPDYLERTIERFEASDSKLDGPDLVSPFED